MKNYSPIYDEIREILANRFSEAVRQINMSYAEVGRRCSVSRQTMAKYMNGINVIPLDVVKVVSDLSNVDYNYLLGYDMIK